MFRVSGFWFHLPTTDDYRLTTNDPPLFSIFKNQLKAPSEFPFCQGLSFQIQSIDKKTRQRGDMTTPHPIFISKINLNPSGISVPSGSVPCTSLGASYEEYLAFGKAILAKVQTFPTDADQTEKPFTAGRQNVHPAILHISFSRQCF